MNSDASMRLLSSFLFIAGGSATFVGLELELQALTWKHTALLVGGLAGLASGMILSSQERSR